MLLSALSYLILLGASMVYVLYCVKPVGNGPLAKFRNFMLYKLPYVFSTVGDRIFGPRFSPAISRAKNYVFFSNNPIVMIFYIFIAPGSYILYIFEVFIKYNGYFNDIHYFTGNALVFFAFYAFYKTYSTDPGIITVENAKYYREKYKTHEDGYIFKSDQICSTCKIVK